MTEIIARRVRELRDGRGWSARELADRLADAGSPQISRSVLASIESGRRPYVTIDELFALACVFDLSPLAFLFPEEDTAYAVTPNRSADSALKVFEWIIGFYGGLPFPEVPRRLLKYVPEGLPDYVADHAEDLYYRSTGMLQGAYIAQARTADVARERLRRIVEALDDPEIAREVIKEILEEAITSSIVDVPEFARRRARSLKEAEK